jgi:hypothetical protein
MYLIWILTLVSNSKLLKRNSKSFSIFHAAQIGFCPNSLEAWSIFPPSPAQLRPAHFGPVQPTSPSSPCGSGGPLLPFVPAEACSLFSFLRLNARAATAPTGATAPCTAMGCPPMLSGRVSEAPPVPPPFPSSSGAQASPLPLLLDLKTAGIENPPPAAALPSLTLHFIALAYIKHPEDPQTMPPLSRSSSPSPSLSSAPPPPSSGYHLGSPPSASLFQRAAHSHPWWGPPGAPLHFPQLMASSHSPKRHRARAPVSPPPLPCSGPWWTKSAAGPWACGHGSWLFTFRNNSKSYNSRGFS